jgi:hypothetical protein
LTPDLQGGDSFLPSPATVTIPAGKDSSSRILGTWTNNCGRIGAFFTASATDFNSVNSNSFDIKVSTPTQQARIILWVGIPCKSQTDFKWTNGNGGNRIVVIREGLLPETPADGAVYSDNNNWATRSNTNKLGTDSYVIKNIMGSSDDAATVYNLDSGKTYYFRVYEYNGCSPTLSKYLTSNASFNPRSRTINCKSGNDLYDLIVDNYTVSSNKGTGIVSFKTLYEQNIVGFEVRRINVNENSNMTPELVGTYMNNKELEALGNTMTGKSYRYTDNSISLEVGQTYLYQLTAIAFDGTRIDVAEAEITITDDVLAGVSEFSVSPVKLEDNNAKFMVTVDNTKNVTIELYDLAGNKVADVANNATINRGTTEYNVAVNKFTNGTYVIVVNCGDASAVQKFQIAR